MDIDPNDLLNTNVFINEPLLNDTIPDEFNDEFRKYYKEQQLKKEDENLKKKLESRTVLSDENTDENNILNTNKFIIDDKDKANAFSKRLKKDIKTLISIDSRDRNKMTYPLASNYKIFLGKTYYNVRQVRLVSVEFPNTNAVINGNNNMVYWINKEDIDSGYVDQITKTYKVYSTPLRIGSYIASTLETELTTKMNLVKRHELKEGTNYHYFVITLDLDTDIVTFISLQLKNLRNNSLTTIAGQGTIITRLDNHGFSTGDSVYILGAQITAGIPSNTINGFQTIIVIDNNSFSFAVNVNASDSIAEGGGNLMHVGVRAPFQFLFGEYSKTVAQNIGYPLENSCSLITTAIKNISNVYQLVITVQNGNFASSYDYVNKNIILNHIPNVTLDGSTCTITNVINSNTFMVRFNMLLNNPLYVSQTENNNGTGSIISNNKDGMMVSISNTGVDNIEIMLPNNMIANNDYYKGWWIMITDVDNDDLENKYNVRQIANYYRSTNSIILNTGLTKKPSKIYNLLLLPSPSITFNNVIYNITSIVNYNINNVSIEFFNNHNYNLSDIGSYITLYDTTSNPDFDGKNKIWGVPSPTKIHITGSIFIGGDASTTTQGEIGTIPSHNILTSKILYIDQINVGTLTTITTKTNHGLSPGDKITINNIAFTPLMTHNIFSVYTIPSEKDFTIQYSSTGVDETSLSSAYIGTDMMTILFPNHGFNLITKIISDPVNANTIIIETHLPHNLVTGDSINITQSITLNDYNPFIITRISSFSFSIISKYESINNRYFLPSDILSVSSKCGLLSLSNKFRLYNCNDTIGGITSNFINNVEFTINEIIDTDTFNFHVYDSYANAIESNGSDMYISSFIHGFSSVQKNIKKNILNRPINLQGENYAYLCCPQLSTISNTGSVKNIFARIILDQSPGGVVFNFLSNPKVFEKTPLDSLDILELSILNYDGSEYIFNDLDYSFTLEITEVIDTTDNFNISSKRGIHDISSN